MSDNFIPPAQMRYARACMVCSIVLTQTVRSFNLHPCIHHHTYPLYTRTNHFQIFIKQRFRQTGCPNCPFLELKNSTEAIETCTSQVFEGLISIADPKKSWIAKWQRIDGYVRGCYATKVSGSLPEEVKAAMEDEGLVYIP